MKTVTLLHLKHLKQFLNSFLTLLLRQFASGALKIGWKHRHCSWSESRDREGNAVKNTAPTQATLSVTGPAGEHATLHMSTNNLPSKEFWTVHTNLNAAHCMYFGGKGGIKTARQRPYMGKETALDALDSQIYNHMAIQGCLL